MLLVGLGYTTNIPLQFILDRKSLASLIYTKNDNRDIEMAFKLIVH